MSPSKYKAKQHNPIHGWLDKIFGGDWMDQDKAEVRKWAKLQDKAKRENQDIAFGRGAIHFLPLSKYDPHGMLVAPGPRLQRASLAQPKAGSAVAIQSSQISGHGSRADYRQSHAVAQAQSRQLQNPGTQSDLAASHPQTCIGSSGLSHTQNNPLEIVTMPASPNRQSSFHPPQPYQSRVSASNFLHPNRGNGVLEPIQDVSGTYVSPPSQIHSSSQQSSLHLHASSQAFNRENSRQSTRSRYYNYAPPSIPPLNESNSAPATSRNHKWEQQSRESSNLRSQTRSSGSSEASNEPSVYSRSLAKARKKNMQITHLEGMVPKAPSELRAEERNNAPPIAPSVWSMSIATSKAQVGNMQRTYLEGLVPKTPSELGAEFSDEERREQELAKSSRRNRQNGVKNGQNKGGS
ncbi:hypothetical protein ONS96_002882 [Cadophora gregata f. sp. sojae]|nr:hypothetical protein ONS96_002882 [Cadophora gregata f. sp. sojae]